MELFEDLVAFRYCCCRFAEHFSTFWSAGIPGMPSNMFFQLGTKPPGFKEDFRGPTTRGRGWVSGRGTIKATWIMGVHWLNQSHSDRSGEAGTETVRVSSTDVCPARQTVGLITS